MVDCPWCKVGLCEASYEEYLPNDLEALHEKQECPHCGKVIKVEINEEITTTFEIHVSEARTKADLQYLDWKLGQVASEKRDTGHGR